MYDGKEQQGDEINNWKKSTQSEIKRNKNFVTLPSSHQTKNIYFLILGINRRKLIFNYVPSVYLLQYMIYK